MSLAACGFRDATVLVVRDEREWATAKVLTCTGRRKFGAAVTT